MNVKEMLISAGRKNTYWNEWIWHNYKKDIRKTIEVKIEELQKNDSIIGYQEISKYRRKIEEEKVPYWSYDINEVNYRMYGIGTSIFGKNTEKKLLFPSIEHGLILYPQAWSDSKETCRAGIVTFGEFRKEILQKEYNIPIYTVGPYIQYAPEYYSIEQRKKIKEKLGKNLLVFLTHSTDQAQISFQEKKYMEQILALKNEFDSINICVFWWNINDSFVKRWEKEGCNIVTAGYREDPMFLPRLKEIIGFSDLVVGDGVGTNIGYCINQNKPFRLLELGTQLEITETSKIEQDARQEHVDKIKKAFATDDYFNEEQMKIYNYYWGGDIKRTKEEIKSIETINKEIVKRSKGFVSKFGNEAEKYLNECSMRECEYEILKNALN